MKEGSCSLSHSHPCLSDSLELMMWELLSWHWWIPPCSYTIEMLTEFFLFSPFTLPVHSHDCTHGLGRFFFTMSSATFHLHSCSGETRVLLFVPFTLHSQVHRALKKVTLSSLCPFRTPPLHTQPQEMMQAAPAMQFISHCRSSTACVAWGCS